MEPVDFEERLVEATHVLQDGVEGLDDWVFATSLGAEDMVVLDLIRKHRPTVSVFMLDTGRLHEETYTFLSDVEAYYGIRIDVVSPATASLETLIARDGINGFYQSVEARQACCAVRKVEGLARMLAGKPGWITGQRRTQSVTRDQLATVHWDSRFGLWKRNPLASWNRHHVWHYLTIHAVPTHPLHAIQMPSIGCAPCTRSITAGEDERAGRWWWEAPASKECGLHR